MNTEIYLKTCEINNYTNTQLSKMENFELTAHIVCVTLIVIFGVSGSTFSIYFYASKKPITVGRIFIIALAILDMFT